MWLDTPGDGHHRLRCLGPGSATSEIEALFSELDDLVRDRPAERFLLDLTGLLFVTSRALADFITTVRRVHTSGGRMAMINVHPFVANVLRTMRIIRLVPIYEVEAEALAFLA